MLHGLKFDENDSNYKLLIEIFKIISSRESKQIMDKNGFKPLKSKKYIEMIKRELINFPDFLEIIFKNSYQLQKIH